MNILFCYDKSFSRANGGIATVSLNLIESLRGKGHKCFGVSVIKDKLQEDKDFYYLPNASTNLNDNENHVWFRKFVDEKNIDIIINQNGNSPKSIWPIEWSKDLPVGRVTVYHSGFFSLFQCNDDRIINNTLVKVFRLRTFFNKLWLHLFRLKYGRWFHRQIILSDSVVTLTPKYFPELQWFSRVKVDKRFKSIYNSIPYIYSSVVYNKEKEKEVLFVGRLSEEKRVDYLLEIWSKICYSHPDWRLTIVGDGLLRGKLEALANDLKLPRVYFEGYANPLDFYKRASIFCLTSSTEGFSLVLVESMSCGCVPIAFNSYACASDIIDNDKCGLLIKPFDTDVYSHKLSLLMDDDKRRTVMSQNAKEKSSFFQMENIVIKWERLFKEICQQTDRR